MPIMKTRLLLFLLLLGLSVTHVAAQTADFTDAIVAGMGMRLRLRDAPSLTSETLDVLDSGVKLMVVGRTTDSTWLQVRAPEGTVGWVAAAYLDVLVDLNSVAVTTNLDSLVHPIQLAENVAQNVRSIFELGQSLGNHPDVFVKVGDSITVASHNLQPIGSDLYTLADYQYLQTVIDHFAAGHIGDANPFTRVSLAAGVGWTTDAVLKPGFADPAHCQPGESPLVCEYRLARPAVALIMFGTNDVAHLDAGTYGYNLGRIVQYSLEQGVIPILSTIPVRVGYEEQSAAFNERVVRLSRRYTIPLWEYGAAMQALPEGGLSPDGVHPSIAAAGYKGAADFRAFNLQYGYVTRNLTTLQMLDAVLQAITP